MSAVIDDWIDESREVHAVLNYTRNNGVRPVNYTFDPPLGVPRSSGEIDARTVTMAVCDARSIDLSDLLASDLVYPDWTGETYALAFNPRHRWYWYPHQTPSEATLLEIFDSATDGRARLTAHTAFDDPASPPDAPPRRSIEVRSILFW